MTHRSIKYLALLIWGALLNPDSSFAQVDTLRVMAYNVLYYGDVPACQGPHMTYHNYLKTIVTHTDPDILGLEKMAAIPMFSGDNSGSAPAGFADSILQFALNTAYPNRYAYCTYTNTSTADNISVLFYDKQKLGFSGIVSSYVNITDFNTYKLYYKSPALASTHDTIFLYVILNHTQSGSGSSSEATRATQIAGVMGQIETHFAQLPNVINMGDFNTHHSAEASYQELVAPFDPAFKFYDPPFFPDAIYSYPADWDSNPSSYAASLTTSTRLSGSIPNTCGTSGGGKSWYDHLFLSAAIINNTMRVHYVPNSYRTIGNDGNRTGISVNSSPANLSAPTAVIDAVFQMSNKYPVMVTLVVDTSAVVSVVGSLKNDHAIKVINPVNEYLTLNFDEYFLDRNVLLKCFDITGRCTIQTEINVKNKFVELPFDVKPGIYYIRFILGDDVTNITVVKQ